jgi:hypothetical protein
MHRTLLFLSLLASGAAAAAHAETVPASPPTAASAAPVAKPHLHRFNAPLTVDQAEALLCPRWNCDSAAIDRSYRAAQAQAQVQTVAVQRPAAPTTVTEASAAGAM